MNSDYRRLIEYRTNRKVTDAAMLTMQDAKIIARLYTGDQYSTIPHMYMFSYGSDVYNPYDLLIEISKMIIAWADDQYSGSVNAHDARLACEDLEVLYNFVALVHRIDVAF